MGCRGDRFKMKSNSRKLDKEVKSIINNEDGDIHAKELFENKGRVGGFDVNLRFLFSYHQQIIFY